ncbi:putative transposase [Trichonephila clavipes]|uniref:Putative transposase n=1 Tax=Trichonephila clavipes TaxID=2585209 RepID=A0A8X6WF86_TRICX|nr:putative transposase [Trichonephila clavipes]
MVFFEEIRPNGIQSYSVIGKRYHDHDMHWNFVRREFQQRGCLPDITFVQGCTPPHVSRRIKHLLNQNFIDAHQGIVHKEFVLQGQTVNQHFYQEFLERLRKRVMRVRPNIKNSWVLHHDNVPCHTAILVNRFLASKNIPVAPQPPYFPDLSHCDFFLFPKLKNHLKGHHFRTRESIQTAVTDQLKAIPISEFHQCYEE